MLLLIGLVSIAGTVIEQDQLPAYYRLNYPEIKSMFFLLTWKTIIALGLDHLYSSYIFFAILLLFFLSLIICTFSTQLPILKQARRWKFFYNKLSVNQIMSSNSHLPTSFVNFIYLLNIKNYYVFHRGKAIYAYKGLLGRIAPIFVHLSIVLTLIGSVFSLSGGFFAQEIIPLGEFFHVQNIVKAGSLSFVPTHISGRVNDFYLEYNIDKSIKQFFSNVSILNSCGSVIYRNSVSVNKPLKIKGLIFYQTNWQISALRIRIGFSSLLEKTLVEIQSITKQNRSWLCKYKISENHQVSVLIMDLSDKILFYNEMGDLITGTYYGVWNVIYGVPILVKDIMPVTGLQIKIDPGVYITYLGFAALMLNTLISYMSYSQIWANDTFNKFYFSGTTNRALLAFEDEIAQISKRYMFLLESHSIKNC